MHKCPIEYCDCTIADRFLMCPLHWKIVPSDLRAQVLRSWNHGTPTPSYCRNRMAALRSVNVVLRGRNDG